MLMTVFVGALALAALIVTVFETGALEQGTAVGNSQVEFVITVVMELLTLGQIWLALRLFKIRQIRQDLVSRKEFALRKWGVLRLEILDIPLVANVLFYEPVHETDFRLSCHYRIDMPALRLSLFSSL